MSPLESTAPVAPYPYSTIKLSLDTGSSKWRDICTLLYSGQLLTYANAHKNTRKQLSRMWEVQSVHQVVAQGQLLFTPSEKHFFNHKHTIQHMLVEVQSLPRIACKSHQWRTGAETTHGCLQISTPTHTCAKKEVATAAGAPQYTVQVCHVPPSVPPAYTISHIFLNLSWKKSRGVLGKPTH